jgi:hypothetical protein
LLLEAQDCQVTVLDSEPTATEERRRHAIAPLVEECDVVVMMMDANLPLTDVQISVLAAKVKGKKVVGIRLGSSITVEAFEKFGSSLIPFVQEKIVAAVCGELVEWANGLMKRANPVRSRRQQDTFVESESRMRLHSYIGEHDVGFAPNPFHGICTLSACKPPVRKYAKIGDYVIGTGTAKRRLQGRLVYLMKVSKIIGFDDYWIAPGFARKKAVMNGSFVQRYGVFITAIR